MAVISIYALVAFATAAVMAFVTEFPVPQTRAIQNKDTLDDGPIVELGSHVIVGEIEKENMTHAQQAYCHAGYAYCNNDPDYCCPCAYGRYSYGGFDGCMPCDPGTYGDVEGASSCEDCAAGSYQPYSGSTDCEMCGAGMYSDRQGATMCSGCEAGSYLETPYICEVCPLGRSSEAGALSCDDWAWWVYVGAFCLVLCLCCCCKKCCCKKPRSAPPPAPPPPARPAPPPARPLPRDRPQMRMSSRDVIARAQMRATQIAPGHAAPPIPPEAQPSRFARPQQTFNQVKTAVWDQEQLKEKMKTYLKEQLDFEDDLAQYATDKLVTPANEFEVLNAMMNEKAMENFLQTIEEDSDAIISRKLFGRKFQRFLQEELDLPEELAFIVSEQLATLDHVELATEAMIDDRAMQNLLNELLEDSQDILIAVMQIRLRDWIVSHTKNWGWFAIKKDKAKLISEEFVTPDTLHLVDGCIHGDQQKQEEAMHHITHGWL